MSKPLDSNTGTPSGSAGARTPIMLKPVRLRPTMKGRRVDPAARAELRALLDGDGPAQPRRRELALPQDEGRTTWIEQQKGKVTRALDALEAEADSLNGLSTYGEITIACALGYLDFRFANEPWRPGHPKLTVWYEMVVAMKPMAKTMPVGYSVIISIS